jgi:hypothetical protein
MQQQRNWGVALCLMRAWVRTVPQERCLPDEFFDHRILERIEGSDYLLPVPSNYGVLCCGV